MFRAKDNVLFKGKENGVVEYFNATLGKYIVYFHKKGKFGIYKPCDVLDLEYQYQIEPLPF